MQRCRSFCNPISNCSSCTDHHHHHQYSGNTSISLLFSSSQMPNHHHHSDYSSYPTITSPSSSSVDCTLSLGTPSSTNNSRHQRNSSSSVSKLCSWNNIFQTNKHKNPPSTAAAATRTGGNAAAGDSALTSRRCANCDTTSTPLWRNGPKGPKSLCNACGIRYKKEERRATSTSNGTGAMQMSMLDSQEQLTWTAQHAQSMPPSCPVTEFRFIEDDDGHSYMNTTTNGAANIPFLPWRLNVPDRHSSLVHDYM